MSKTTPLLPDCYYHIYNRGHNRENLFFEERNYRYFLQLYAKYIEPVAYTYAYCLLPNHFHFLIRIKTEAEQKAKHEKKPFRENPALFKLLASSQQFSNFFNSYARSINNTYNRSGTLFAGRFKRKPINHPRYFTNLAVYIHRNPQTHGLVDDFRDWTWSSYEAIAHDKLTKVQKTAVYDWFGSHPQFIDGHVKNVDEMEIRPFLFE